MIYIYGLIDPRTHEICYVGQSVHYLTRYRQHLADTRDTSKVQWIAELRQSELEPWLVVLDTAQDRIGANQKEEWWIVFARHMQWRSVNSTYPTGSQVGIPHHLSEQLRVAKEEAKRAANRAWLLVYGFICLFIIFGIIFLVASAIIEGPTSVELQGNYVLSIRWMFVVIWLIQFFTVYSHHIIRTDEIEARHRDHLDIIYLVLAACYVIFGAGSLIELGRLLP